MTQETYKYRFDQTVQAQDLEDTFMLALLAVESLHSRSRVRMEGQFKIDKNNCTFIIDAATTVGRDLARIFTGFVTCEYGDHAVHIKRIGRDSKPQPAAASATSMESAI